MRITANELSIEPGPPGSGLMRVVVGERHVDIGGRTQKMLCGEVFVYPLELQVLATLLNKDGEKPKAR